TTSPRAILFNHQGKPVATAQKEFKQIYPENGWVEHDPMEIWSSQASVATEVMIKAGLKPSDVQAIGIPTQRETTIFGTREPAKPIYNAIVWQDRRTAAHCDRLREQGKAEEIRAKTGLIIDAYFSATKTAWILDEVPQARKEAENGKLAFGTVDS